MDQRIVKKRIKAVGDLSKNELSEISVAWWPIYFTGGNIEKALELNKEESAYSHKNMAAVLMEAHELSIGQKNIRARAFHER